MLKSKKKKKSSNENRYPLILGNIEANLKLPKPTEKNETKNYPGGAIQSQKIKDKLDYEDYDDNDHDQLFGADFDNGNVSIISCIYYYYYHLFGVYLNKFLFLWFQYLDFASN